MNKFTENSQIITKNIKKSVTLWITGLSLMNNLACSPKIFTNSSDKNFSINKAKWFGKIDKKIINDAVQFLSKYKNYAVSDMNGKKIKIENSNYEWNNILSLVEESQIGKKEISFAYDLSKWWDITNISLCRNDFGNGPWDNNVKWFVNILSDIDKNEILNKDMYLWVKFMQYVDKYHYLDSERLVISRIFENERYVVSCEELQKNLGKKISFVYDVDKSTGNIINFKLYRDDFWGTKTEYFKDKIKRLRDK